MTNSKPSEYLITFMTAVILAVIIAFCAELELLFRCEQNVNKVQLNMANLSKFATIEQLEKRLEEVPNDYIACVKLAQIYERLQEYKKAEEYYTNAMNISDKSYFVVYNYALFCAHIGRFSKATYFADDMSGKTQKILTYKASIYEAIGDGMLQVAPRGAVRAYQVAYRYAKNVKNKKFQKNIAEKYAYGYVSLADRYVAVKEPEEAFSALENSLKIVDTPLARYKMGLLYMDFDKKKAEKYMSKAMVQDPYIINPYIYNSLVSSLISDAQTKKDNNSKNYYSMKLNKFKNQMLNAYVYRGDLDICNSKIISKKKKNYLSFNIKNNTNNKIQNLYIYVDLFINSNQYTLSDRIVHSGHELYGNEEWENVKIELPSSVDLKNLNPNSTITAKYYAKKFKRSPDTLVKIEYFNF